MLQTSITRCLSVLLFIPPLPQPSSSLEAAFKTLSSFLQIGNRTPHLQTIASGHLVAAFFLRVTLTKSAVGSVAEKGDLHPDYDGAKRGGALPEHTQNISGSGSKELLHHYSKGGKRGPIYFGNSPSWTHPGPLRMLSYMLLLITVEIIPLTLLFAHIPRVHDVSVSLTTRGSAAAVRPDGGAEGAALLSAGTPPSAVGCFVFVPFYSHT